MGNIITLPPLGGVGSSPATAHDPDGPTRAVDLPSGFFMQPDGIWMQCADDEGTDVWLCSPIIVSGICSRLDGTGWGRIIDVTTPDGHEQRVMLDEAAVQGTAAHLLKPLYERGLVLAPFNGADKALVSLIRAWRPKGRYKRADRPGWLGQDYDDYVLPSGSSVGKHSVFAAPSVARSGFGGSGTVEGWKQEVGAQCRGNPLAILAVSQAFAGPLLRPLGLQGGGFHFYGASSCGKSTVFKMAASVWGSPDQMPTWRTTDNGLEVLASQSNDGLLILDDIGESQSRVAGEAVYMLGNGQPKRRMSRDGGGAPAFDWSLALLSNGEISLAGHLAAGGIQMHEGQGVRLVDVPADVRVYGAFDDLNGQTSGKSLSDLVKIVTRKHHGLVGPAFVKARLGKLGADQVSAMRSTMDRFIRDAALRHDLIEDGQTSRILQRFALAMVAGELATQAGLTGWARGDAYAGVMSSIGIWSSARDSSTRGELEELTKSIKAFYRAAVFDTKGAPSRVGASGWQDDAFIYVSTAAWREQHGEEALDVARLLQKHGLLASNSGRSLQRKTPGWVPGRPKAYALRRSELEAEERA